MYRIGSGAGVESESESESEQPHHGSTPLILTATSVGTTLVPIETCLYYTAILDKFWWVQNRVRSASSAPHENQHPFLMYSHVIVALSPK